jgi:predicted transcriptional regulator
MSAKQLPVAFPIEIRHKLSVIALHRRVPMAVIVREAVEAYLAADDTQEAHLARLLALIRSPTHWPQIHAALVEQTLALQSAPPAAASPAATWTYQRPADAPSRAQPPSVDTPTTGDTNHPF